MGLCRTLSKLPEQLIFCCQNGTVVLTICSHRMALEFYAPDDECRSGARNMRQSLDFLLAEFKEGQMKSARKSYSSALAKPNSAVAALLDEANNLAFMNSLVPSNSTLLVVPGVLVEHWRVRGLLAYLLRLAGSHLF